jgi:hypothetical protein
MLPHTHTFKAVPSGVNFTEILHAAFSYECLARSFIVLEVKVTLFIGAKKMAHKMWMKLPSGGRVEAT